MSSASILEILKYAGFAVAAVSAIWALATKTTYEDENQRKRLTAAGQVAVALVVGSMLTGMAAFGFETMAKDAEKQASASRAAVERAEQAARDQLDVQRDLLRRTEAAALAAAAADQRTLTVRSENAQRVRDLLIAGDINRASIANLTRAEAALERLDRLMHPLGEIDITVTFTIRPSTYDSASLRQLSDLLVQQQRNPNSVDPAAHAVFAHSSRSRTRFTWVEIDESSPLFPARDDRIFAAIVRPQITIDITKNGSRESRSNDEAMQTGIVQLISDLHFTLAGYAPHRRLRYFPGDHIRMSVHMIVPEHLISRSQRIISIRDLANANLIVTWMRSPVRALPLNYDVSIDHIAIAFGGREFDFDSDEFRVAEVQGRPRKYFIIRTMGDPIDYPRPRDPNRY